MEKWNVTFVTPDDFDTKFEEVRESKDYTDAYLQTVFSHHEEIFIVKVEKWEEKR